MRERARAGLAAGLRDGASGRAKITVVGGGSYLWSHTIIKDVVLSGPLAGSRLALYDIDSEALDDLYALGLKTVEEAGSDVELARAGTLEEALSGAEFVVLCISTGGLEAMSHDLEIPQEYGVVQTVGDTVGPGGIFRALRNVPVVVDIARAMEEHCPDATLINLTNPMTALTRAVTKATSVRAVGLCHELFFTLEVLAEVYGVPEEELDVRVAGINHFIWLTDLFLGGRSVMDDLRQRLLGGEVRETVLEMTGDFTPFTNTWAFRTEMCRLYGYLPAAGDRHVCEFLPRYLESAAERDRLDLRATSIEDRRRRMQRSKERIRRMNAGEEPIPMGRSREEISDIIAAMTAGKDSVHIVNLPNEGQISNLPQDAVVETMGVVNASGARGIAYGELPPQLLTLVYPHVINQEIIVEAALSGKRELAFRAFVNDSLVANHPDARIMFDRLMEAHAPYLPQFAEEA